MMNRTTEARTGLLVAVAGLLEAVPGLRQRSADDKASGLRLLHRRHHHHRHRLLLMWLWLIPVRHLRLGGGKGKRLRRLLEL